jgi:uncharacterized repeat protein (TIGR02543 family)
MSLFLKKKFNGVLIAVVLIMIAAFIGVISVHTDKAFADIYEFSISDGVQNEDSIEFTITRSSSGNSAVIYYRTISGTAIEGTHFVAAEGSVSFAPGEASKVVSVAILGAHNQYADSLSSAYTNIDRDFFLEIYGDVGYEITHALGQGIIPAEPEYFVDFVFFDDGAVFLNHTEILPQSANPNFSLMLPRLAYHAAVSSEYHLQGTVTYENASEGEVFTLGFSYEEPNLGGQYNSYSMGDLIDVNIAQYAIQVHADEAGDCIAAFPGGASTNVIMGSEKTNKDIVDNHVVMGIDPLFDIFVYVETTGSQQGGVKSVTVSGKAYDAQAPVLRDVSGLNHPQKVGDEIYISLIFDEIIDASSSLLDDTYIGSNSGNFVYQYGTGSNVLVFKGVLGEGIDAIIFDAFNGEIRDYSYNETDLSIPTKSVTVQNIVTFYDEDGVAYGNDTEQAPQTVQIFQPATRPEDPFRLGYMFVGWFIDDGSDLVLYDFEQEVTEDINLFAVWSGYFATEDAEGTEESPFVISEFAHLVNMSGLFSAESEVYEIYKDKYFVLANNITAGAGFNIIGDISGKYFYGTFDGNGYVISNLSIDSMFAALMMANYGTIKNLGIEGSMTGMLAAGIALTNSGTIINCFNGATVTASTTGAGIAAYNFDAYKYAPDGSDCDYDLIEAGEIINCYNLGEIVNSGGLAMLGGITTQLGSVISCYNAAAVEDGAPIAVVPQSIEDCYFDRYYYEDEAGFYSVYMVGENSLTHENLLYNALAASTPDVWVQPANDEHAWYYPQIKVFYDNGNYPYSRNVYTIEIDFDNDQPNIMKHALESRYAEAPAEPSKPLYLFDGWRLGGDAFDFNTHEIGSDLYITAQWAIYHLVFDISGTNVTGIDIAEGQENVVVTIPDFVTHIGTAAFGEKEVITSLIFAANSNIESIGAVAFYGTYITELNIPSSISTLPYNAFDGMVMLESITVENGAIYHKTENGALYDAEMTTLLFYPLNKQDTALIVPSGVTEINDYAFCDVIYQRGNGYLEQIAMPDGLSHIGEYALFGLVNLNNVIITNTAPIATPDETMFRYFDPIEGTMNNQNLIIDLPSYTAYTNYMANTGWDDFEDNYRFPVVINFEYQGATAGFSEITRTTVDGIVDGQTIYNKMAMGAMPAPLKYGYDFVGWNTSADASGDTVTAETLIDTDITLFAIWAEWTEITVSNGGKDNILVNGADYNKSLDDIIAVSSVTRIFFDNFDCPERIELVGKTVTLTGSIYFRFDDYPIRISSASNVVLNLEILEQIWFITLAIPQGADATKVEYYHDGVSHKFLQSQTVDMVLSSEGVSVPHPGPGYGILCWNAEGNIGRNIQTIYFEDLPTEYVYSPVIAPTLTVTDMTQDYIHDGTPQGATYNTYINYDELADVECDVEYFENASDMLSRSNAIAMPTDAGQYYYVIFREGRTDYCDIDPKYGSYTIRKPATIIWQTESSYTYTGLEQHNTVKAYYYDINDQQIFTAVIFSGESNEFKNAGTYIAQAEVPEEGYEFSNVTIELVINKAQAMVLGSQVQSYSYDGAIKEVVTYLNHNETTLQYEPQQGYTIVGTYQIVVSAEETQNYLATSLIVTLEINQGEYSDISHGELYATYVPGLTLADIPLDENFYWVTPDMPIYAGEAQRFDAYYNEDFDNYVSYELEIEVSIEKADPGIEELPLAANIAAGRPLSASALTGGITGVDGDFVWGDGSEIIYVAGLNSREVVFIPADPDNYYTASFYVDIVTYLLEVSFVSQGQEDTVYVIYGATIAAEDFPSPSTNEGYSVDWQAAGDIINITADMTINAVYTLLNPQVDYFGYTQPVTYGEAVTLQADPTHALASVTFFYEWYFNEQLISDTNFVTLTQVAQSGNYILRVAATDGEQTKFAETAIEVIINKAAAIITADSTQEHTFDGLQKYAAATLNHTETTLIYSQQWYVDANEAGYAITVSAEETDNYLAAEIEILLIINKATVDMSGVLFEDRTFVYNGQSRSLEISGELPTLVGGLSVNYINNSLIIVGEVVVIAEFEYNEYNYNPIPNMSATLKIEPRPISIIIHDKSSTYGQPQAELTCAVYDLIEGDELYLLLTKSGDMKAGTYEINGRIGNPNYTANFVNGTYTILKATHDMSGVSFNNKTVTFNAQIQSLEVSGNLPTGVTVAYANNARRDCGSYEAIANFSVDTANYNAIEAMSATFTIVPKPLTVAFSDYNALVYDGKVKTVGVRLNGIPAAETAEIKPTVSYDKEVIEAGYYTATVTIANANYTLSGATTLNFIVYLPALEHAKGNEKDVIASLSPGFLPGSSITVNSVSQRAVITSDGYKGKESKQTFEVSISGTNLTAGQKILVRMLINEEHKYLEDLKVCKLEEDGSLTEIQSAREGDYLIIEIGDTAAQYVIIGEGKQAVLWVYAVIGAVFVLLVLAIVLIVVSKRKAKQLRLRILGK